MLSKSLETFGYRCTANTDGTHYRVGPLDPLVIHEWKELKNVVKASSPTKLARGAINAEASPLYQTGELATQPHGTSYIDLEVYVIQPGKAVRIAGSKLISAPLSKLFPLLPAVFGPLKLAMPRTAFLLKKEYGHDVLVKRVAKVITGSGSRWGKIPDNVRKIAWPVVELVRASRFLNIK
jgi:hypothetical protein